MKKKVENKDYLTENNLIDYLKIIYPEANDWIRDKRFSKEIAFRPDYRSDSLKIVIEFDGYRHYTNANIIQKDNIKNIVFEKYGYKVIHIPYFVQASKYTFKVLFDKEIEIEQKYPHGFISNELTCYLPASFCELGIIKFLEDLERFNKIKSEILNSLMEKLKYNDRNIYEVFPLVFINQNSDILENSISKEINELICFKK
ncbi:MAG: endonuclease domain-containing protein [Staphylococcus sp.]|nr:endonuclease domain-containing protein [Staphylococcus sp.]